MKKTDVMMLICSGICAKHCASMGDHNFFDREKWEIITYPVALRASTGDNNFFGERNGKS
jgi:hypothetical protein